MKLHRNVMAFIAAGCLVLLPCTRSVAQEKAIFGEEPFGRLEVGTPIGNRWPITVWYGSDNCAGAEVAFEFQIDGQSTWNTMTPETFQENPWSEGASCAYRTLYWDWELDFEALSIPIESRSITEFYVGVEVQLDSGEIARFAAASPISLEGASQLPPTFTLTNLACSVDETANITASSIGVVPVPTPDAVNGFSQDQFSRQTIVAKKYDSTGSTKPLGVSFPPAFPVDQTPRGLGFQFSDSQMMVLTPFTVLGIFGGNIVATPSTMADNFAPNEARVSASSIAAVGELSSGVHVSRDSSDVYPWDLVYRAGAPDVTPATAEAGNLANSQINRGTQKRYILGSYHHGIPTRGGTFYDNYWAIGSWNVASANISSSADSDPQGNTSTWKRNHVDTIQGAEFRAQISGRSHDDTSTHFDARQIPLSDRAISPTHVSNLSASQSTQLASQKAVGGLTFAGADAVYVGGSGKKRGGYFHRAIATHNEVGSRIGDSRVNVRKAVGTLIQLVLNEGVGLDRGERLGSRMDSWIGVDFFPGASFDPRLKMPVANGLLVWSQLDRINGSGGRGSPVREHMTSQVKAFFAPANLRRLPESYAAILTMDSVIIGDGQADIATTGCSTDLANFAAVHLTPRSVPPAFSSVLPPSERAGCVYFDEATQSLKVCVAAPSNPAGTWSSQESVWFSVKPLVAQTLPTDLKPYSFPKITVTTTSSTNPTVRTKGFGAALPDAILYRVLGQGRRESGATEWKSATLPTADPTTLAISNNEYDYEFTVTINLSAAASTSPGWDGTSAQSGQLVELLAVKNDSAMGPRTSGTSFELLLP